MTTQVDAVPAGYAGLIPYLIVTDPEAVIDFYKRAFGATEILRLPGKDGAIMHAEVKIGDAVVMLAGEMGSQHRAPPTVGGTSLSLCMYVPDVDGFAAKAEAEGAEVIQPLETKFYGDRSVSYRDPSGHVWSFMTHVEDVTPEQMRERMTAMADA